MKKFGIVVAAMLAVGIMGQASAEVLNGIAVKVNVYMPTTAQKDKGGIIELKCGTTGASQIVGPTGHKVTGYTMRCYHDDVHVYLHHAAWDLAEEEIAWESSNRWWMDDTGVTIPTAPRDTCAENAGKSVSQYTWFPLYTVDVIDTGGWLALDVMNSGTCWQLQ